MKRNFHGGIHNSNGNDKILTNRIPIKKYNPKVIEVSMMQSVGRICKAIVNKGDKIIKGQLIGIPKDFGTAGIHSGINGIVTNIRKDENNHEVKLITIQSDNSNDKTSKNNDNQYDNSTHKRDRIVGDNEDNDYRSMIVDISNYSKEMIITSMKNGGIIGMGGAGFPANIKYETDKIECILINGAECEPYLTCDHRMMLEYGYDIINGIRLLIKAADAKKAIICIEDNKKDVATYLESLLVGKSLPVEIKLLVTRYPQGGERQLIEAVIKKEVPARRLPADIGVVVNNIGTVKAVADMVFKNLPLIERVITVTGHVKKPSNYYVPIGTRYSDLIELAGGITSKNYRIIVGGPMTGTCIMAGGKPNDIIGSVLKTSSGLVVLEDYTLIETPCIKCGKCERVCPAGLAPYKIDYAAINDDIRMCDRLYATECISCGSCSYVCPANRELAYRITASKMEIYNQRNEKGGK